MEIGRNIFLNLDQKASQQNFNNTSFYLSNKGWHTNTQSWTDANVVNSLRGKVISIKELEIQDEKEALSKYGSSASGASLGDILGSVLKK